LQPYTTDRPRQPLHEQWAKLATKELKGKNPEEVLTWRTAEGLNVKPVYTQADTKGIPEEIPGAFPFTRGPYASMYTARPWTVRQVCTFIFCITLKRVNKIQKQRVEQVLDDSIIVFLSPNHGFRSEGSNSGYGFGKKKNWLSTLREIKTETYLDLIIFTIASFFRTR
jgi:methylmalonyl-CoA mutase